MGEVDSQIVKKVYVVENNKYPGKLENYLTVLDFLSLGVNHQMGWYGAPELQSISELNGFDQVINAENPEEESKKFADNLLRTIYWHSTDQLGFWGLSSDFIQYYLNVDNTFVKCPIYIKDKYTGYCLQQEKNKINSKTYAHRLWKIST